MPVCILIWHVVTVPHGDRTILGFQSRDPPADAELFSAWQGIVAREETKLFIVSRGFISLIACSVWLGR